MAFPKEKKYNNETEVKTFVMFKCTVAGLSQGLKFWGGLVVMGGDNVSPLVEIGLADLPNIGGAKAPQPPSCDNPG